LVFSAEPHSYLDAGNLVESEGSMNVDEANAKDLFELRVSERLRTGDEHLLIGDPDGRVWSENLRLLRHGDRVIRYTVERGSLDVEAKLMRHASRRKVRTLHYTDTSEAAGLADFTREQRTIVFVHSTDGSERCTYPLCELLLGKAAEAGEQGLGPGTCALILIGGRAGDLRLDPDRRPRISRGRGCDNNRLSGVTHLRPTGSGVLHALNLLCEAFAGRKSDFVFGNLRKGRTVHGMTRAEGVIRERKG
jgi:hypothetical protein